MIDRYSFFSKNGEDKPHIMEPSVKALWCGAIVALVVVVLLCVLGQIWSAIAFLFSALILTVAALLHNKAVLLRERKMQQLKDETAEILRRAELKSESDFKEAKGDISRYHSLISHGIRIPTSIIIGYADLILDGMITDDSVRDTYIRKISEKASYINELLTYILLEMKVETKISTIMKEKIELLSLLRSAAEEMTAIAAKNGVVIRVVSECDEIYIQGDPIGLTKSFYNIIENSFKYMGRPGYINITASKLGSEEALIVFKDNGLGLEQAEADRIFDLNYQGTNRRMGSGIGLYIVKTEVLAHGGSVYAKSDAGKGMGIYITLPAIENTQELLLKEDEPYTAETVSGEAVPGETAVGAPEKEPETVFALVR